MYTDLTDFLTDLDRRKLLTRIADAVSPNLEIAAVTDRACKMAGGGPALLFTNPSGFSMPVASNIFGSMERMCLALGVKTLDDLASEIDELMTPQMPAGIMDALKMLPMVSRLKDLKARGCVLVGHPEYYRQFGFSNPQGLVVEGVPPEVFFALSFDGRTPQGTVAFQEAFKADR